MDVKEAIVQRLVDPADVALFETFGVSFGRKPEKVKLSTKKVTGKPERVY
jgi:hypothetical protein